MEDLCIDCGKVVTNRHQALMCEPRDRWQHRRCNTGISQYAYREGVRNGTPVEWTCSECLESARLEEMREMAAYIEGASAGYEFCPNLHSTALSASSPPASPFSSPPSSPRSPMSVTSPMSISSPPVSPSFTSPPTSPSPPQLSLPTSPASPSPPVSPIQRSLPTSPASPSPPVSPLPALPNISNTFALDPAIFTPPRHEEISLEDPTPNEVDIDTDAPIKTYEIVEGGTQRRGKMLVDSAGYSYTMKRAGKKITLWICSVRSKCLWCKATVQQKGDTFVEGPIEHLHPASGGLLTITKVKAKMKDAGMKDMFTSARVIVGDVVKTTRTRPNEPVDAFPGNELLERILNRFRASQRPAEPKTLDFDIVMEWLPDNFLQRDLKGDGYRHLILATEQMLHILAISKVWYVDATFKVIREPFAQLFSIHAFIKHGTACKQIPLAFVMMTHRRKVDYEMVFSAIKDMMPTEPELGRVVLDYEMATWQAVASVFPHVEMMGCE